MPANIRRKKPKKVADPMDTESSEATDEMRISKQAKKKSLPRIYWQKGEQWN
jgi:hypothetical protein